MRDVISEIPADITTRVCGTTYDCQADIRLTWCESLPPLVALRVAEAGAVSWEFDRHLLEAGLVATPGLPAGGGRVVVWRDHDLLHIHLRNDGHGSTVSLPAIYVHAFLARTIGVAPVSASSGVDWDTELAALLAGEVGHE